MKVIHKYKLFPGYNNLSLPNGTVYRHVDCQNNELYLWVEKPDYVECEELHEFYVAATGEYIDDEHVYLGSAVMHNGLVWHLYSWGY